MEKILENDKLTTPIDLRSLEKGMDILSEVQMPELPWWIVDKGIKSSGKWPYWNGYTIYSQKTIRR